MNPEQQTSSQQPQAVVAPETPQSFQSPTMGSAPVQAPLAQTPAPKKTGKLVAIIVIVLLLLAGAGYGAYALLGSDDKANTTANSTSTSTTPASDTTETKTDSSAATDTKTTTSNDLARKAALSSLQTDLETYYGNYVYYPTASQLTSSTFQKSNLTAFNKSIADSKLTLSIGATLTDSNIAYKPTPTSCNNSSADCMGYEISVQLSAKQADGTYVYTKKSLN